MSNEFPGDEWDQSFSEFDDSNDDDGFEEFETASFGEPETDPSSPGNPPPAANPAEPVTSPSPVIKSSSSAPNDDGEEPESNTQDSVDDVAAPKITRIEKEEEVFEPVVYDDADFDDIILSPTAFRAPDPSSVLEDNSVKNHKGKPKGLDISKLDEKAQRKTPAPNPDDEQKQQEKLAKQQEKEAKRQEKREQLQQEKAEKEQLKQQKKAEREQKRLLRKEVAAQKSAEKAESSHDGRRKAIAGIGALAAVAVGIPAAVGLYSVVQRGSDAAETAAAAPSSAPTSASAPADPAKASTAPVDAPEKAFEDYVAQRCQETSGGGETVTRANGDGSTAVDAIKGFNYAYFTLKDAEAATKFLDSSMYKSVESLQQGINHPDNGDGYCLHIQDSTSNVYKVSLIEFLKPDGPGSEIKMWKTDQNVTVKNNGGRWVMSGQEIVS